MTITAIPEATTAVPAVPVDTFTLTLTNTCQCGVCPDEDHGYGNYLSACDECGAEREPVDCGGFCWQDAVEALTDEFERWAKTNRAYRGGCVFSTDSFGWANRRIEGLYLPGEHGDPYRIMSVNSEWEQRWTFPVGRGDITVVSSHHDSPVGELWTLTAARAADYHRHN